MLSEALLPSCERKRLFQPCSDYREVLKSIPAPIIRVQTRQAVPPGEVNFNRNCGFRSSSGYCDNLLGSQPPPDQCHCCHAASWSEENGPRGWLGPKRAAPRKACNLPDLDLLGIQVPKTRSLSFDLSHFELQHSRCRAALSARPKAKGGRPTWTQTSDGRAACWPQGYGPQSSDQDKALIQTE